MPTPANALNIQTAGFVTFDGVSAFNGRTLTAGTGVTITNGNGVSGNPTISVTAGSTVIETITGNTGGAQSPLAGNFNILGTGSITVSGTANTETVQLTGLTDHSVLVGAGTATITKLSVGTNGQVLIGASTADPAFATLTSSDSSITFTIGANTLSLQVAGGTSVGKTITGDSGGALSPIAGNWNLLGSGSITTSGSGSTLTTQLTGLTNHALLVGAGTTTITKVGPTSTAGQVLQSAGSSADPVFSTATYPSTTTVSQILYSSSINVVSGLATANRAVLTTTTTGVPQLTALATDGQFIIGSTAGAPAAASITSSDNSITITPGSNSISLTVTGGTTVGKTITGDTGGALSPTSGNWNIIGGTVVAGTSPLKTAGSASTLTINAQRSQALASADSTKVGLSNFNSAQFSVDANGFVSATGTVAITTTENSGTATPSSGNLNILGTNSALTGFSPWTTGSGSTITLNMPGTVKWVVNATANLGTHTTIQAAITAASSGDTVFITDGSYTEDLTLKVGVNITALTTSGDTPNVTIIGNSTLTAAGTVTISNVRLQTNSAALLTVSGSAASIINLNTCYLNCSNNNGITFSAANTSSAINIYNCKGNLGTTGIALFSMSSTGSLVINQCNFSNTGNSTTANTVSAGSFFGFYSIIGNPITSSSTGVLALSHFTIMCGTINATCIIHGGSTASNANYCNFGSGTASAISISTTLSIYSAVVTSNNTNAITGAGTLIYVGIIFQGTSSKINTTSQTGGLMQGGLTQAPSAGFIGEQIKSVTAIGSAVNMSGSTTPTNLTSISLTAGIWDVSGLISINNNGATIVSTQGSVNTTSATLGTEGDNSIFGLNGVVGTYDGFVVIPPWRLVITATTTVYLIAAVAYTSGPPKGYGRISATRVG